MQESWELCPRLQRNLGRGQNQELHTALPAVGPSPTSEVHNGLGRDTDLTGSVPLHAGKRRQERGMWASGISMLALLGQTSVKAVVAALHRGSYFSALSKHLYRGGWNKAFPSLPEVFLWTVSVFALLRF